MPVLTANSSLLTYSSKLYEVLQYYFAPSSTDSETVDVPNSLYAFIGRVTPWPDPFNPPAPTQDQYSIKETFKNIIAAKKIISSDISPVVPRRDWTSGTIYDYYDDRVNMFPLDANNLVSKNFYIKNRYDQVFICLWNNRGEASTVEPQLTPGTFDATFLVQTSDGYKWKFIYSIDAGVKQRFLDESWMPVPVGFNVPNPTVNDTAEGQIDVINITTVGQGYQSGGVDVVITGDGSGAAASPVINAAGYLTDMVMTSVGSGYTYANTTITPATGYSTPNVAAVAMTPVSPTGGHGLDPISDLGCNNVMVAIEFAQDEGGVIPTDIAYYQLGLILDPSSQQTTPYYCFGDIYDVTKQFTVSPGTGTFVSGQTIYQGPNLGSATFTAQVVSFDATNNVLRVINTSGTPTINDALIQDASGAVNVAVRTLLATSEPDFLIYSGYMTYIENRTAIQRSADGTEQFRLVLRF
jgi:hypothetical protein